MSQPDCSQAESKKSKHTDQYQQQPGTERCQRQAPEPQHPEAGSERRSDLRPGRLVAQSPVHDEDDRARSLLRHNDIRAVRRRDRHSCRVTAFTASPRGVGSIGMTLPVTPPARKLRFGAVAPITSDRVRVAGP